MPTESPIFTAAIAGDSMLPVLRAGDWVLVRRTRGIRSGHIVAIQDPRKLERILVKRAIKPMAGDWWVLGDNPDRSTDSRTFGPVSGELVLGRVVARYYPLPFRWFGLF